MEVIVTSHQLLLLAGPPPLPLQDIMLTAVQFPVLSSRTAPADDNPALSWVLGIKLRLEVGQVAVEVVTVTAAYTDVGGWGSLKQHPGWETKVQEERLLRARGHRSNQNHPQ